MPTPGANSTKTESTPKTQAGFIRCPQEILILCVVSALDVIMTCRLLERVDIEFVESNPFAAYFLDHWGIEGLAYFKAGMTLLVCVITQIVARKEPLLAKRFLALATMIIVVVVVYSVWLHFNHREVVVEFESEVRAAVSTMLHLSCIKMDCLRLAVT